MANREVGSLATDEGDWEGCFDRALDVELEGSNGGTVRVYEKGSSGPVLLLLHGAGLSSMSFALFAQKMSIKCDACRIVAYDCRGHGFTTLSPANDFSVETLCRDVELICNQVVRGEQTIVIGHSMGGAIAVHAVSRGKVPNVAALCVIDVVEATAMMALSAMSRIIQARPTHFTSLEDAVSWCLMSKTVNNADSARISMPGQLKWIPLNSVGAHVRQTLSSSFAEEEEEEEEEAEKKEAQHEKSEGQMRGEASIADPRGRPPLFQPPRIKQMSNANVVQGERHKASIDKEEKETIDARDDANNPRVLTWAVDLFSTKPYWTEWFKGVSARFLACPCTKLLVTAGVDRLTDKTLIIGQMQGKFQMHIVRESGHCVQEDAPDNLVEVVHGILKRVLTLAKLNAAKASSS